MVLSKDPRLPRDADALVREVDAAIRIHDLKSMQRMREALEVKWWEPGIVVLLFISGLGFIITVFKLIPADNSMLFWFVFFWFLLFTMCLLTTVEFLLRKISALRNLYDLQARLVEQLLANLQKSGRPQMPSCPVEDALPPPHSGPQTG